LSEPLLRIEHLSTSFGTERGPVRAVDDVSFSLEESRTLGLVGESGSGKTVTALSVMGLLDSAGRIEAGSRIVFRGRDLVGLDDAELRGIRGSDLTMIFQEPSRSLNPVLPVGWQIVESIKAHEHVSRDAATGRATELLALVGIPKPASRMRDYPHQLSGGMCQRVMIAMALACKPKLLIADEPTTALDVTVQAQILDLIAGLRETFAMAVLLITHDLGVVAQVADEVAVMYAGRIVETGPVASVFASPQHPYTEALMQSTPLLGMRYTNRPLHAIAGQVPSLHAMPSGCRFRGRCRYGFDLCAEQPDLFRVGAQQSACWLCQHGPRRPAEALAGTGR
jgi:peptide/nickel transport system ATP-binding protein/oligopeptide transport system ATP-binding protein